MNQFRTMTLNPRPSFWQCRPVIFESENHDGGRVGGGPKRPDPLPVPNREVVERHDDPPTDIGSAGG